MKRALVLFALTLTACEAPVLEAPQSPTRCAYRFSGTPTRYDPLELGKQTPSGFVPFVDQEDVEIAPWSVEDSVGRWYFQDVFVRLSPIADVGATVCAQVEGDLGLSNDQGVLLTRASDGGYVGGPVPFATNITINEQERFVEVLDASVTFTGQVLVGNASDLVGGYLPANSLRQVNHVGLRGVPKPPPPP